jgi:hypothetical protein
VVVISPLGGRVDRWEDQESGVDISAYMETNTITEKAPPLNPGIDRMPM